jgi:predicted ribosomally synthesized peptide with SipW-like signal peptide
MSRIASAARSKNTRGKVLALLSGGLILGLGATATLASWNDSEWVNGGVDATTSGVVLSTFQVQQNRGSGWGDFAAAPGGSLTFTAPTTGLTPGDAAYTQVSLRTTSDSIAGTVALMAGAPDTSGSFPATDSALWSALRLRVVVTTGAPGTCALGSFAPGATFVIGDDTTGVAMSTAGGLTRTLSAAGADQQNYCFQLLLPAGSSSALMGMEASPVWQFSSTSN